VVAAQIITGQILQEQQDKAKQVVLGLLPVTMELVVVAEQTLLGKMVQVVVAAPAEMVYLLLLMVVL
jgi:hypothetical protein